MKTTHKNITLHSTLRYLSRKVTQNKIHSLLNSKLGEELMTFLKHSFLNESFDIAQT